MKHSFVMNYSVELGNGPDIKTMKGLIYNLCRNKKLTKNQVRLWDRIKHRFQVWEGQTADKGLMLGGRHINDDNLYCYYYYFDGKKIEVLTGEVCNEPLYPNM